MSGNDYYITNDQEFNHLHLFVHILNHDTWHHHHGSTDYDILIHDHDGSPNHEHYLMDDNNDEHPDEFYDNYGAADHEHKIKAPT